jgi:beta-phosphoglucomutase
LIRAVAFDLDGTLVYTESLKALSYARAAKELCRERVSQEEVIDAYNRLIGRSRQEVAQTLMRRFGLEEVARERMAELGADSPWEAYVKIRLRIFDSMIRDPDLVKSSGRRPVIALVGETRRMGLETALTTTSSRENTELVLDALCLESAFDFIATSDDVAKPKPDPEVYQLVLRKLGLSRKELLAIEDSLPGVQAALASGVRCIAVPTECTKSSMEDLGTRDRVRVVDDKELACLVKKVIAGHEQERV